MKLLAWDFDGVIVDTYGFSYEIWNKLREEPLSEEAFKDFFNGNVFETTGSALGGDGPRVQTVSPFFQEYKPRLMGSPIVPGMAECIRACVARGVPLVIVSSTIDEMIEEFLDTHGLRDCFAKLYGATVGKDKRVKLQQALADFGALPQESLYVTDTLGDIRDAAAVGISAVGVTWGYHPTERLAEGVPMAIVHTPSELEMFLRKY